MRDLVSDLGLDWRIVRRQVLRAIKKALIGVVLLLIGVGIAFVLLILVQRAAGTTLRGAILSGSVIGAIVGFMGVLVGQYLTQRRHSQSLLQAQELEAQRAHEAALQNYFEQVGSY